MLKKPTKSKTNHKAKTEALRISNETYNIVYERDKGCILCQELGLHEKIIAAKTMPPLECHHVVSRARLGMGIEQNLVMLCLYHHHEETMHREVIKGYLRGEYDNWNEEELVYKKMIGE